MPSLNETRKDLNNRLNALELKAARFGYNVPAEISMEIEDVKRKLRNLDGVVHYVTLIDTNRKRLFYLVRQRDIQGTNTPPHILTEIAETRFAIRQYISACRDAGFGVDPDPLDEDEPSAPQPSGVPSSTSRPPSLDAIREVVRSALWYIENDYKQDAIKSLRVLLEKL